MVQFLGNFESPRELGLREAASEQYVAVNLLVLQAMESHTGPQTVVANESNMYIISRS
jgi:hypothetical protein